MKSGMILATMMSVLMATPCWSQTPRKAQGPRRLSDSVKGELAMCLRKGPGRFSITSIANDGEAYRYAQDWREVFMSAGWEIEHPDIPIQSFRIGGGAWTGMRVGVHDASATEGKTALADNSPEENFSRCVVGRHDIPVGGRIISYKDRPTGLVSIQISVQPQQ